MSESPGSKPLFGKLFAFVFSFFGIILLLPLIVAVAVLVFKFDLRSFTEMHPLAVAMAIAAYAFIWVMAFFGLQQVFLVWKPDPATAPVGKEALIAKLEKSFAGPFEGKKLFDVFRSDDDRLAITWSSSISCFQVAAGGRIGKKRVVVLTFDEKNHEAFFLMKDKDWRWSASPKKFDFSMRFAAGIFAEISTDFAPSLSIADDGSVTVHVQKLSYDSRELWLPIEKTLLASGWTIRGGMFRGWGYALAVAIPLALLLFFPIYFIMQSAPSATGATAQPMPPEQTAAADQETYRKNEAAQIAVSGKRMSAGQIETTLDGLMKVPARYFKDYEYAFIAYARVYGEKKDKSPEFMARLSAFARERGIESLTVSPE